MDVISYLRLIAAVLGFLYTYLLFMRSREDVLFAEGLELRRYAAITTLLIFTGGLITQGIYVISAALTLGTHHKALEVNDYLFTLGSLVSALLAGVIYSRRLRLLVLLHEATLDDRPAS